ncbi:MAG TPA: TlpA disulfide reductase family protein [Flavisolibacter sp.]|nr:TlpA disulfide reductase family protein [Flavisolibacter sp.]
MKQVRFILAFFLLFLLFSCGISTRDAPTGKAQKQSAENNPQTLQLQSNIPVNATAISKDFATWYNYTYTNVRLAQDFLGLNVDSVVIQKANFLDQLGTGQFIPVKIGVRQNLPIYQLFRLQHVDKDIQLTVQQMAATEKEHVKMEGKVLPSYDFKDLNGRQYNKAITQGKILLVKCWFINCFACVQEFPELNKLVERFQGTDDLLFVSLASDSREELSSFLVKKPFHYAVVPNQGPYMSEKLGITAYPTHLLVDKSGKIIKVTNSIEDMLPFIEKQVGGNDL